MAAPGTIDRAQHGGAGELDTAQWLPLSGHAIDAILDIDDLAVRNLWITQGWANLAGRLGRFFGVDHTWCTFAVWTSSTAGRTIRSGQLISEAVSVVDTVVFRQIAPLFTGLAERLERGDVHPDDGAAVLRDLGLDPTSPEPRCRAFRLYVEAATDREATSRAQRIFAANVLIESVYQQLLQAAVVAVARPNVLCVLMGLRTPEGVIREELDVPSLPGGAIFPPALAEVAHPDAVDVLARWDRTGGTGAGSRVTDWADPSERLSFALNLYRSRQRCAVWALAPFTHDQLDAMRRFEPPEGPLLVG